MASAYFSSNQIDKLAIFEMYVRKLPKNRNYLVVAGLEHVINFLLNLKFKNEHIEFLKNHDIFKGSEEKFFDYLLNLKFSGNLWAVPEGSIIFANEPILRIEAPIIEAQIVETFILSLINLFVFLILYLPLNFMFLYLWNLIEPYSKYQSKFEFSFLRLFIIKISFHSINQ